MEPMRQGSTVRMLIGQLNEAKASRKDGGSGNVIVDHERAPWPIYKAMLEILLIAVQQEPDKAEEANAALVKLNEKLYTDFLNERVTLTEMQAFFDEKMQRRLVQILPSGQAGSDLMRTIVTVLTMAGGGDTWNEWATAIAVQVVERDTAARP